MFHCIHNIELCVSHFIKTIPTFATYIMTIKNNLKFQTKIFVIKYLGEKSNNKWKMSPNTYGFIFIKMN